MSISGISSGYSAYTYQWNNQQLQSSSTNSSTSANATASNYSFEGSSTISSMIELIQYSMDAMGVSSNERITFNQVDKYKQELEDSFSKELQARIEATGIDSSASFTVSLDDAGKIIVNTAHADKSKIQNYFDTNPNIGTDLLKSMEESGLDIDGPIQFNVSGAGTISLVSSSSTSLQSAFSGNETLGTELIKKLEEAEISIDEGIKLKYNAGTLSTDDEELSNYLEVNPELAEEIKAVLEEKELSQYDDITFDIDKSGNITVDSPLEDTDLAIQKFLIEKSVGQDFKLGLASQGIDPNIDFRLSVEDGRVVVNSSHPDAAMVQALLDADENLGKTYLQIDSLAGLDAARKAMQIDPTEMRKRIEMESMSTWWAQSGTSSFSTYADGNLSSMTGINSVV